MGAAGRCSQRTTDNVPARMAWMADQQGPTAGSWWTNRKPPGLWPVLLLTICQLTMMAATPPEFTPDFRVHPDDVTVLMAVDATRTAGLAPFQAGGHGKFFVKDWKTAEQCATWTVEVPESDGYFVNVLLSNRGKQALRITVVSGDHQVSAPFASGGWRWNRQRLDGRLHLAAGRRQLTLRLGTLDGVGDFDVQVHAIELVRPATDARQRAAAQAMRADTTWFQQAGHGFMVHWTADSCPRHGVPKPYDQAVQDFDVEAFANQMQEGGAGFVLFTTAHGRQFFPAPLRALDAILPGRTSRRDLVADLAAALGRRGIRLMLYYHLGAISDPAWLEASAFWQTDTSRFFANWKSIISEAGARYGDRLAGWWFDDGSVNYYYRSAPWEDLARTAKVGHPQRLIAFNSWELPPPTAFMDFHCGEGDQDPTGNGDLAVGGDGHFHHGPYAGLQASVCLVTEGDWGHFSHDSVIGPPRWTAEQMSDLLRRFSERRNVPIFNLEIYQDGTVSAQTIAMFKTARMMASMQRR